MAEEASAWDMAITLWASSSMGPKKSLASDTPLEDPATKDLVGKMKSLAIARDFKTLGARNICTSSKVTMAG